MMEKKNRGMWSNLTHRLEFRVDYLKCHANAPHLLGPLLCGLLAVKNDGL